MAAILAIETGQKKRVAYPFNSVPYPISKLDKFLKNGLKSLCAASFPCTLIIEPQEETEREGPTMNFHLREKGKGKILINAAAQR